LKSDVIHLTLENKNKIKTRHKKILYSKFIYYNHFVTMAIVVGLVGFEHVREWHYIFKTSKDNYIANSIHHAKKKIPHFIQA
jgi:hypothetical protein